MHVSKHTWSDIDPKPVGFFLYPITQDVINFLICAFIILQKSLIWVGIPKHVYPFIQLPWFCLTELYHIVNIFYIPFSMLFRLHKFVQDRNFKFLWFFKTINLLWNWKYASIIGDGDTLLKIICYWGNK